MALMPLRSQHEKLRLPGRICACIGGAIGALSGELHGGANIQVMRMLLEIGETDKVDVWVKSRLDDGEGVMGMGHAVCKTTDPRADILARLSKIISRKIHHGKITNSGRRCH